MAEKETPELERCVLGPDDKLVIRVRPDITAIQLDSFAEALRQGFLRDRVLVIGAEQIIIVRPGEAVQDA